MPERKPFEILMLNKIAQVGLEAPAGRTLSHRQGGRRTRTPSWCVRRNMHEMQIPASVKAIGRAGAGTNNIPVKTMSERGVPVFNAPGANANAVKELVIAGMLIAARNSPPRCEFVRGLSGDDETLAQAGRRRQEALRRHGTAEHTLGVIGLGEIGSLVADAAIRLGMNVLGYDPEITVDAAWGLPAQVKKANSIDEVLKAQRFRHAARAAAAATRKLINAKKRVELMKRGQRCCSIFRATASSTSDAVLAGAGRAQAASTTCAISPTAGWPAARRDRAAAPRRVHARSRGQLRGDGRRTRCANTSSTATWPTRSIFPT